MWTGASATAVDSYGLVLVHSSVLGGYVDIGIIVSFCFSVGLVSRRNAFTCRNAVASQLHLPDYCHDSIYTPVILVFLCLAQRLRLKGGLV